MELGLDAWVARSLDAEPELLPVLPELLADLEDLAARADEVVDVLRGHGLAPGSSVLDLGCGKGAAAIAVAAAFGCTVHGVDGLPQFVAHAGRCAAERGVGDRCTFAVADLREVVGSERGHDLVMLLGLGPVLGDLAATVGALRRCVRPGGLVLIDDAYLAAGADPSVAECAGHEETLRRLRCHGDELLAERVVDGPETAGWYRQVLASIALRAGEVAARRPDLGAAIGRFVARQVDETALLVGPVVGAMWLLRTSGGSLPDGPGHRVG